MKLNYTNKDQLELKLEVVNNITFLNKNGAEDVEYHDGEYNFYHDGYFYSAQDIADNINETLEDAVLWSCCGDEVNKDWMMCPSCKEHI